MLLLKNIDESTLRRTGRGFQKKLADAIGKIQLRRRARHFVKAGTLKGGVTNLSSESTGTTIDPPMWSAAGREALCDVDDLPGLALALQNLQYFPSKEYAFLYIFSEQAIFAQGWYTENEAAVFAESRLNKKGVRCDRITVELTDEGKKKLQSMTKAQIDIYKLPALRYKENGAEKILVLPFFKDLSELSGMVTYDDTTDIYTSSCQNARISVTLGVVPASGGKHANTGDAASSLTGGSTQVRTEYKSLLSVDVPLWELSNDAVDVGYTMVSDLGGGQISGILDAPSGRTVSDSPVDLSKYRIVSEKININTPAKSFTIERPLAKDEDICSRFHTIAVNVPDLTEKSVARLDTLRHEARDTSLSPNEISALRWYSRSVIGRFVATQCANERHLSRVLNVTVARRKKLRVIAVHSSISKEGTFSSSIDLLHTNPEFISGNEDDQKAFNIQSGFFDTRLEGKALPDGKSIYDIWDMAPEGTRIVPLMGETKDNLLTQLRKMQAPKSMLKRLESTYDIVLFPTCPSYVNGKMKWAWLQVNRDTFETTSCFDTGEHGAMTDYILEGLLNDVNQFLMGAWKGVEGSLWAVSAFSLRLDNYDEILKAAQQYVGYIGNNAFGLSGGKPDGMQIGMGTGSIVPNVSFNDFKVDINLLGGPRLNPNQNVFGWSNGWKAGVALYFQAAKAHKK